MKRGGRKEAGRRKEGGRKEEGRVLRVRSKTAFKKIKRDHFRILKADSFSAILVRHFEKRRKEGGRKGFAGSVKNRILKNKGLDYFGILKADSFSVILVCHFEKRRKERGRKEEGWRKEGFCGFGQKPRFKK